MRAILVVTACLAAIAGCASAPTVSGTLTLVGNVDRASASCSGQGGYDDIHEGADVLLKDGAGVIIGTGTLAFDAEADKRGNVCVFNFTIPTKEADFYSATIGSRGGPTWSKAEMEAQGWTIGLTLGD